MHEILIADGDRTLIERTAQFLQQVDYRVYTAGSAAEVLDHLKNHNPHLLLIDLTLPGSGGLEFCDVLRSHPKAAHVPILLLTKEQENHSAAEALEAGGDDFIRKPFAMRELLARIRANLRWVKANSNHPASLRIIPGTFQVFVNGREVILTRVEFRLLEHLGHKPEVWHDIQELLEQVWHYPNGVGDAALVRNHIRNLRRKIEEDPDRPEIIQSRHGRGYAIQARVQFGTANYL